VRDRSATVIWKRYCGTAAKAGGNGENKLLPTVMGVSCLLENIGPAGSGIKRKLLTYYLYKVPRQEVFYYDPNDPFSKNPLFHHSTIPLLQLLKPFISQGKLSLS
jgi:hypothetical protein